MNNELVQYIENEIFPLYNKNEEGHGINHIKTVIKRSLKLAKDYDADLDMVYTIASYHDLGHYIDRKTHEIISAKMFMQDDKLEIAQREQIDFMIDDSYDVCKKLSTNGIKTIYFRDKEMKKLEQNEYLKEVSNWGEIYRIIKNESR